MKLLLIVIDGLAYHLTERFLYTLPTLQKIAEKGAYGSLESSYPSITPIALASLFTGVSPKVHGVVAPKVFVKGRKIQSSLSAFSSSSLLADPLWAILGKRGFKTLVTSAPQSLPDIWKLDNTILFDPYKAKPKKCSEGTVIKEGENEGWGKKWIVKKGESGYEIDLEGQSLWLDVGRWSGPVISELECGEDKSEAVFFLHAREDGVYISPPSFLNYKWGNREGLIKDVWENVVKKTGMMLDGDYKSLNKGIISFDEYVKTAELSFNFFSEYSLYLLKKGDWDVGITYLPLVDNFQHLLYGIDDEKSYDYIHYAYRLADKFVSLHEGLAETLIVCSDHGITKIKKRVYINKILERINVLKMDDKNRVDWRRTKAYYGGGGIIRVNLRDREEAGIVSKREYPKLVRYIVKHLEGLTDERGEVVFTGIHMRDEPAGDRQGDIELSVREYYSMSSSTDHIAEIEDVKPYVTATADHGYYRKEDMYGVILMDGPTIAKGKKVKARIIDVAPTVLKILGISGWKMEGRILTEALNLGGKE